MNNRIHNYVVKLCKLYGTTNPFEIAKQKNILILKENLGTINGYYNMPLRQKQIHLNENLNEFEMRFTCAHELGHALLHPKANTPFLISSTYLSVNKLEIEANSFAIEMLLSDEDLVALIHEHNNLDIISSVTGYSKELLMLKQSIH
ncbi:ImmA/IrrE family metallo-endopeptidase [Falcatimonas sp. MSJ-15]|uniref:ImmA/IrrE family metallo-endopeptidase n=1 Tax=Falcatimonas sp. MSJ-15 TaxID=2841515 RepID=UPI001C0FDDC4|nr:ImmA/IrrE family metallo-endopeptidase [Falcatimonas sp. MSJ-15]MBU5469165.1 ImmA/IrrE family metallo-endopeptidase [Falcatimonas sp. MSJ-15]